MQRLRRNKVKRGEDLPEEDKTPYLRDDDVLVLSDVSYTCPCCPVPLGEGSGIDTDPIGMRSDLIAYTFGKARKQGFQHLMIVSSVSILRHLGSSYRLEARGEVAYCTHNHASCTVEKPSRVVSEGAMVGKVTHIGMVPIGNPAIEVCNMTGLDRAIEGGYPDLVQAELVRYTLEYGEVVAHRLCQGSGAKVYPSAMR